MIKNNQDYQSILILFMVQKDPIENRIWDVNENTSETSYHIEKVKTMRLLPNSFELVSRNEVAVFYVYAKPNDNKDKTV